MAGEPSVSRGPGQCGFHRKIPQQQRSGLIPRHPEADQLFQQGGGQRATCNSGSSQQKRIVELPFCVGVSDRACRLLEIRQVALGYVENGLTPQNTEPPGFIYAVGLSSVRGLVHHFDSLRVTYEDES
ncbi:hypothetical protein ACTWQF_08240 [Streptomyces sp. 8N114]|uniref:hypothetical protein n=1 Tax=Streptomyces sp. 8N114 TaxID=3457419 RepID=UPI003FD423AD